MRFGILGDVFACDAGGGGLGLGGPLRRGVLALLLLDAGRLVPVERLVDGVYGERPPAGVANAVQSQMSRLRSVLGDVIERRPAGYLLAVEPDEVDVHRFLRLAAAGRVALTAGDGERAARLLADGLALWRGPALADVRELPFAAAQVTRLEDAWAGAREDAADAGLALGRHGDVVAGLQELVAAFPLRERAVARLMRALAGAGRQAEALEVYESTRRGLADGLGADPGPELASVHLAVLRGAVSRETPSPSAHVSRETTPAVDRVSRETPLPARLTSFVGGTAELARVADRLSAHRLVTLTGPGGAGKTRLSVEAAERFAGAVCFVPLAGVVDGGDVPQAVLGALGLREGGLMPSPGPGPEPLERIVAALAHRSLLLVLDNCEHVIDATAALVQDLLTGCPEVRVLATSREALGITGEALCPVPPLALPPDGAEEPVSGSPAVRLFADRARAVRPDFVLEDDRAAVLRICRALDGLPLAIELAAARLRSMSATEIADRLGVPESEEDQRFRLLSRGSRTAQPRQRTLRGVVDWSWELLAPPERTLLRRLSVFAGGWRLDAAEAVCGDPAELPAGEVLDLLDSLAEKSLVVVDHAPGGATRYRLLETIRAYAAERLAEAGEAGRVRRAYVAHYLDLAARAEPRLRRAEQLEWLALLRADHDNLTAALNRAVGDGDHDSALRMLAVLTTYWMLRGLRNEGVEPARRILAALGEAPPAELGDEYVMCVLTLAPAVDQPDALVQQLEYSRRIIEGRMVRYPVMWLLWAMIAGVPDDATHARYSERLPEWVDDPWMAGLYCMGEGYWNWLVQGRSAEAEEAFATSLRRFRELGDRWGSVLALTQLAGLLLSGGHHAQALAVIDESLRLAADLGAAENRAELLCHRGWCGLLAGDPAAARADYGRAAALARECGATEFTALSHLGLAECARAEGAYAAARELCALADAACPPEWLSGHTTRSEVRLAQARIDVAEGDPAAARTRLRAAMAFPMNARNRPFAAAVTEALADVRLAEGEPVGAAELLGLAGVLRGPLAAATPDAVRIRRVVAAAVTGPEFTAAVDRGTPRDPDAGLALLTAALDG